MSTSNPLSNGDANIVMLFSLLADSPLHLILLVSITVSLNSTHGSLTFISMLLYNYLKYKYSFTSNHTIHYPNTVHLFLIECVHHSLPL